MNEMIPLQVTARVAHAMELTARQLSQLKVGDVVSLRQDTQQPSGIIPGRDPAVRPVNWEPPATRLAIKNNRQAI